MKDAKSDNVAAWVAMSLLAGVMLDSRTPWPVQVDITLSALVVGDVALLWFLRDDVGRWWAPHRRVLRWLWIALRVTFTKETWRDVRKARRSAIERRKVKGSAHELLALVDDPRAARHALALIKQWVTKAAPVGSGQAWVELATPRVVRSVKETATGVELVVVLPAQAGSAEKVKGWAGGIESQAGIARGSLTISHIDGQPPHVTLWRFTLRSLPSAGVAKVQTGRSVADGVTMGVDAVTGASVVFPIVGYHGLTAAITNAGKSNTLSVEAEQIAACDDAELWVIDHTEGMPWLRHVAARYYDTAEDARNALGDLWAEYARRNAYRRSAELAEIPPSREWPHIRVVFDEVPNLLVTIKAGKEREAFVERWAELMRLSRKEGITVHLASQRFTDDTVPRPLSTQCALRIGLTLPSVDSQLLLGHAHVAGRIDCSLLRPKTGEACVMLPGATDARRVNISRRSERSPGAPKPPTAWAAPNVSDRVSEHVSAVLSDDLSDTSRHVPEHAQEGAGGPEAVDALTRWTLRVLEALDAAGEPMTVRALAEQFGCSRPTLVPVVRQLVAEGFLVEIPAGKAKAYGLASDVDA